MKPIAGTSSCEAPHSQCHVSGRPAIRMDDGTESASGRAAQLGRRSPRRLSEQAAVAALKRLM